MISDSERAALNRAKTNKIKIKRNKLRATPGNILPDYTNNGNDFNYYV